MAVFLTSKLSQAERLQVAKLGELLEGRMADTFSGSGNVCSVQKPLLKRPQCSWGTPFLK